MTTQQEKPSLSRGLDAILKLHESPLTSTQQKKGVESGELLEIPITHLQAGKFQPRREFHQEELEALSKSIVVQGIIQPLIVRQLDRSSYEIIAGERRWRAAKMAGLNVVPVIVRQIDDEVAAAFSLIENIQRKDLNPLEEALALQRLIDEFNLSHDKVATSVGRSRTSVTNLLRLLTLESSVKRALNQGDISMGHARALVTLPATEQRKLCAAMIEKHLSVRQAEELVRHTLIRNSSVKHQASLTNKQKKLTQLSQQVTLQLQIDTKITFTNANYYQISLKLESFEKLEQLILKLQQLT